MGQASQPTAGQQLHANVTQYPIHFLNYDPVAPSTINNSMYFLDKIKMNDAAIRFRQ